MLRLLWLAGLAALLTTSGVRADVITEIFHQDIEVFSNHKGDGTPKKVRSGDVITPAAVLSNPSPLGLIRVRFEFEGGAKKPVIGWVDEDAIRIDKTKPDIKVPGCPTPGQHAGVSRGSRGFGENCR